MESGEVKMLLKAFRKESSRHVLVIEADMAEDDRRNVFSISNRLRLAGNELIATMRNNIAQLLRTKRYRKLKALYGKAVENSDKALKSHLSAQMKEMLDDHGVSWDYCRRAMIPIGKKYHLPSVFALTRAEDMISGRVSRRSSTLMERCSASQREESFPFSGPSRLKGSSRSRTLLAVWFSHVVE